VTVLTRGTLDGIQVLSDRGEAEICDDRVARVVHEYIWLPGSQHGGETKFGTTYPLKVPMNHITGVEVAEASGNIGYLASWE